METLEQLKAIAENAPIQELGKEVFVNSGGGYIMFNGEHFFMLVGGVWMMCGYGSNCRGLRSIQDIKEIIKLREDLISIGEGMINEHMQKA